MALRSGHESSRVIPFDRPRAVDGRAAPPARAAGAMMLAAHDVVEIDGAHGEGGGQLVRIAVALAAITGTRVRVTNIRAKRDKPGLAAQHVAAIRAVAGLCSAEVEGLAIGAEAIGFAPRPLAGGEFRFDVGTAGSVSLVAQALLPVMVAANAPCRVHITGGTDVRQAPPVDYLRHVLFPLLAHLGVRASLEVVRRGYYPRGGGEVALAVAPATLRPAIFGVPGAERRVRGIAHVANLDERIAARMRKGAVERLALAGVRDAEIETRVLGPLDAKGQGGAIVLWAPSDATVLGAARVAERGVRAEDLGHAVATELAVDILNGAALDVHAADQVLPYLALAGGGGFTTRTFSSHAHTASWLVERFLPVRCAVEERGGLARVTVAPR
ncbi:MAG: RNA 3'-terminal phosphate cyclase [Burkholderiales bacterium]|nr:RNA 3'-terminal phosphate cyclase [Burkholderiales bacterium]